MNEFSQLLNNQVLFWSLISCLTAQLLKIIFNFFIEGKFRFKVIFETGGMPSSHSALVSALTAGLGWEIGFDNSVFALAVGVSLIVMYDASGIRRSAGLQAQALNKISKILDEKTDLDLKEKLGHTKLQVVIGSVLGPLITLPGIIYFGSPLNILNSFLN